MKHLVTLRKVDGTTVIAFVEARTEEDAKLKALNTANGIAKDNKSRVLMSERPLKVGSVEVWKNASNRIVTGLKKYEALVVSQRGIVENRMVGFAGEKSVYNSIIKTLMPREELRVFIRDLAQVPVEVKKPAKKVTLKDVYKVIENKGWSIYEDKREDGIDLELSQYSSAGEDFNFTIYFDGTINDLKHKISDYVYSFDRDEHIEMHLGVGGIDTSGLPSIRSLVKDADDILNMLNELSRKVNKLSIKGVTLKDAYEVIENDGWSIYEDEREDGIDLELSQYSSARGDFYFSIFFDGTVYDLKDKIYDYANDFDVSEHINTHLGIDGNNTSGLPSIDRLVEDADDIFEMLRELEAAVHQVKEN